MTEANQNMIGDSATEKQANDVSVSSPGAANNISLDFGSLMARVKKMPAALRDYFYSEEIGTKRAEIYSKHNVTDEDESVCFVTELQVLNREIPIEKFPDELWSRLDWPDEDEEKAVRLIADILGIIIKPASAFVGDVVGQLHDLGVNPEEYPSDAIQDRIITYDKAVDEIVEALDIQGLSQSDEKRLKHIIESHLRDVRDEIETRRMLTKPRKTGGLELTETEAMRILKYTEDEMHMTKYVEEMPEVTGDIAAEEIKEETQYSPEDIKAILAGPAEEQKEIAKSLQTMVEKTDGNVDMVSETLNGYMYPETLDVPDSADVVAALMLFARQGNLVSALMDDKRYQGMVKAFFQQVGKSVDKEILDEPAGPKAMNHFLQVVLRGIAQLSEDDSARYGLRIINALKKKGETQYVELVAFDMDQGKFVWTEPLEI